MPPILDVAIGTVFVFLLFSLVVSAFNEFILSIFDLRAKFLHRGLREILGDAQPTTVWEKMHTLHSWLHWLSLGLVGKPKIDGMTKRLCEHGLLNAMSRSDKGAGASPSYIPSGAFVVALLDIIKAPPTPEQPKDRSDELAKSGVPAVPSDPVVPAEQEQMKEDEHGTPGAAAVQAISLDQTVPVISEALALTSKNIQGWIALLQEPNPKLYQSLNSLFLTVNGDVESFKTAVEAWFNASMDRVSGWYKSFSQKWTIIIAVVLAGVLNVDTIHIVKVLSNNPNLAKAVATEAEGYHTKNQAPPTTEETFAAYEKDKAAVVQARKDLAKAMAGKDSTEIADARAQLEFSEAALDRETKFQKAIGILSDTSLPLGWDSSQLKALGLDDETPDTCWLKFWEPQHFHGWFSAHSGQFLLLFAGWLITALAASLGAPFWFDLLGRFINIRAAGRAPGDRDPTQAASPETKTATLDSTPKEKLPAAAS